MQTGMKSRLRWRCSCLRPWRGLSQGQDQGSSRCPDPGGTIYDGSTAKPFTGDVAITGDKIVYVGPKATMTAKRTIDAHGMIVSPGLIDAHTHSDHFLDSPDKTQRSNAAWTMQGVSTVFLGIDGNGRIVVAGYSWDHDLPGVGANVVSYVGFAPSARR